MNNFKTVLWIFLSVISLTFPCSSQDSPSMNPEQPEKKKPLLPELIPTKRPQNSQTTITANNSASFDNRSGIAEFSGNVQISDPQFELSCEKLRAILREDRKGLQRVEAIGNVVIRHHSKDESGKDVLSTAKAGKAIYHVETGDLELIEWPQITQGINSHVANEPQTKMLLNRAGRIITTGSSKTVIADTGNAKP